MNKIRDNQHRPDLFFWKIKLEHNQSRKSNGYEHIKNAKDAIAANTSEIKMWEYYEQRQSSEYENRFSFYFSYSINIYRSLNLKNATVN